MRKTRTTWRVTWRLAVLILILFIVVWNAHFFWNAVGIRGYSMGYPKTVISQTALQPAHEQVVPEGGETEARTCGRSQVVEVQAHLIDFLVNQNEWVPAMPQFKVGVLGLIGWEDTPWFDNKAAFQLGVLAALRRNSIELTDILGRERGTSEADSNLQAARGLVAFDDRTWWFNPFDEQRSFGPVTPSPRHYRRAIRLYNRYNDDLEKCQALYDARADNLFQLLDRVAKDIGSTVDALAKRSTGRVYDARTDTFVQGEGNNRGWFDFRADNLFMFASGQMYAYHGILQGARADFAPIVESRDLEDVWNRMEQHVAAAAVLSPLIISNGREDGFLMPAHLSTLAQNILRARANMTELRDILKR